MGMDMRWVMTSPSPILIKKVGQSSNPIPYMINSDIPIKIETYLDG